MWIFTIVAATAVVGTVIWLDWPRWKAWATDTTPPRHRATGDDVEHHASKLIARLEEELRWEADEQALRDMGSFTVQRGGIRYPDDWAVMVGAPAESIDDMAAPAFNERGE